MGSMELLWIHIRPPFRIRPSSANKGQGIHVENCDLNETGSIYSKAEGNFKLYLLFLSFLFLFGNPSPPKHQIGSEAAPREKQSISFPHVTEQIQFWSAVLSTWVHFQVHRYPLGIFTFQTWPSHSTRAQVWCCVASPFTWLSLIWVRAAQKPKQQLCAETGTPCTPLKEVLHSKIFTALCQCMMNAGRVSISSLSAFIHSYCFSYPAFGSNSPKHARVCSESRLFRASHRRVSKKRCASPNEITHVIWRETTSTILNILCCHECSSQRALQGFVSHRMRLSVCLPRYPPISAHTCLSGPAQPSASCLPLLRVATRPGVAAPPWAPRGWASSARPGATPGPCSAGWAGGWGGSARLGGSVGTCPSSHWERELPRLESARTTFLLSSFPR